MRVLWAKDAPMSPAEVLHDLNAGLAYTSIAHGIPEHPERR